MNSDEVIEHLVSAIRQAETILPQDVVNALKQAKEEESGAARVQLEAMLKNVDAARNGSIPMCQDTGIQTFIVHVGAEFSGLSSLRPQIIDAVKRATSEVPLRPNTVHPFSGENPGDNVGEHIPYISWDIVDGDTCVIDLLPKGGGSENCAGLKMLSPGVGIKGVKRFIVDHVVDCAGKPCPPGIIGVGIGGGADLSLKLAKLSLLRPVGSRHPESNVAVLEEELRDLINISGIGPMGMGGKTTCLDVHIEYAHRHPASLPVGIIYQCWSDRRARVTIDAHGRIEVI
ncbi:MAG: fumarate hydratase [Candidatus Bipolaricaulota bacterium]|nr:fumarate hydratase [Candidatus Bipolaricaulota bacterium]